MSRRFSFDETPEVCPKCGGEIHHAHYLPGETSAGCETFVDQCLECDWQGEPS